MPIHVTLDPMIEDGLTVEAIAESMVQLKPTTLTVDLADPLGRVLLASLQARGLPAQALEKRPRPVLAEVQRIEELSRDVERLKREAELHELELRHLREYQQDVRILIQRLD